MQSKLKKVNMQIEKQKEKLIITSLEDFNIVQTLDCGQIFRYTINGNTAVVKSMDKCAYINFSSNRIEIESADIDYFYNFFDLNRNYTKIKQQLSNDSFLRPAIEYGSGIRIINNDPYEMIISFIISANNNIGRIKKSIEYICTYFGNNMGDYYAFPTLAQLKTATVKDFTLAGLGYRAPQLFETVQRLTSEQIENLKTLSVTEQFNFLTSLKGVGEKVANCILLFGLGVKTVFPVDTWINKVYNNLTGCVQTDRKKITKELTNRYGNLSGYAQQYFFYYYRDNKIN